MLTSRPSPVRRWSAKEAAYKALGGAVPGSGGVRPAFPELVVCSDEAPGGGGGVALRLEGAARSLADKAGVTTTLLRYAHSPAIPTLVISRTG